MGINWGSAFTNLGEGLGDMAKTRARQVELEAQRLHDENMVRLRAKVAKQQQLDKESRGLEATIAAEGRRKTEAIEGEKRRKKLNEESTIAAEDRRKSAKDVTDSSSKLTKFKETLTRYVHSADADTQAMDPKAYVQDIAGLFSTFSGVGVSESDTEEMRRISAEAMTRVGESTEFDVYGFIKTFSEGGSLPAGGPVSKGPPSSGGGGFMDSVGSTLSGAAESVGDLFGGGAGAEPAPQKKASSAGSSFDLFSNPAPVPGRGATQQDVQSFQGYLGGMGRGLPSSNKPPPAGSAPIPRRGNNSPSAMQDFEKYLKGQTAGM
jgi:hypothetical protein